MTVLNYPLQQVLIIKQKREDLARQEFLKKKELLAIEEKKLSEAIAKKNEVENHYNQKLNELYGQIDEGVTVRKIQEGKRYLLVVKERIKEETSKVEQQTKVRDQAYKRQEIAKADYQKRQKEVEKMDLHKVEWTNEQKKELLKTEVSQEDELSSLVFQFQKTQQQRSNANEWL